MTEEGVVAFKRRLGNPADDPTSALCHYQFAVTRPDYWPVRQKT
jgi:hypothetical protein